MDYVQRFIDFIENEYAEKVKEMLEEGGNILNVELADIYRFDPYLGIRILNALLSGKDEMMYEILSNVAGLIKVISHLPENFTIRIPNRIEFLKDADPKNANKKESFRGHVAIKTAKGEIGIILPRNDNIVEVFLMKYNGKVRVGELVSGYGVWKKRRGGRCYFLVKELKVEKESIMEELEEIDLDKVALLPEDYRERLVEFIERKYKMIIDEMIEKENIKEITIDLEDLLSFDAELGRPAIKNPNHVLPLFYQVIDDYLKIRFVLKKGLMPWAILRGEKVILKREFIKELGELLGISLSQEKLAELIGGESKESDVVVHFKDFVKFVISYRSR